jgi:hypothetical protein
MQQKPECAWQMMIWLIRVASIIINIPRILHA